MYLVPKRYFVTDGAGISYVSPLNAFDQALRNAGIAHLNLVPVSSILPPNAREVKYEDLPPGAITFVVMSRIEGRDGERIAAGLAWAKGEKHGYVIEGHSREDIDLKERLLDMVREVERLSNTRFTDVKTRIRELRVPAGAYGSVVVALVLIL